MNKKFGIGLGLVLGAVAVIAAAVVLTQSAPVVGTEIGSAELVRLKGDGAMIVDVRTQAEFEGSHIPDAINVPMDRIVEMATTWDKARTIVVYCATGSRSEQAAAYLDGQGFTNVHNLTKGIVEWTGETVAGSGTAPAPEGGAGAVKTSGRPLFIDFSSST